jgi:hypothetical protein
VSVSKAGRIIGMTMFAYTSDQRQHDSDTVGEVDFKVEQEYSNNDGQDLLAVRRYRHR